MSFLRGTVNEFVKEISHRIYFTTFDCAMLILVTLTTAVNIFLHVSLYLRVFIASHREFISACMNLQLRTDNN